jgi:hypothetical protein
VTGTVEPLALGSDRLYAGAGKGQARVRGCFLVRLEEIEASDESSGELVRLPIGR